MKENVQMWVGCISGALTVDEYEKILSTLGFQQIKIDPVHIYTKEMLQVMAKSKGLESLYQEDEEPIFDGAFAGALVSAVK